MSVGGHGIHDDALTDDLECRIVRRHSRELLAPQPLERLGRLPKPRIRDLIGVFLFACSIKLTISPQKSWLIGQPVFL